MSGLPRRRRVVSSVLTKPPRSSLSRAGNAWRAFLSATGGSMQRSILLPYNPYKMHVARAAAQTLTNNATTTLLFDTIVYDSSNNYDSTTGQYTIPISGYYVTDAIINVVMPAVVVEQFAYLSLYVNGAEKRRGHGE